MDTYRHKALYMKKGEALSPRDKNRIIRNQKKAVRAQQREDVFNTNRRMFVNDSTEDENLCTTLPIGKDHLITSTPFTAKGVKAKQTPCVLNKENIDVASDNNSSKTKVACTVQNEYVTRKEAYLKRFIEWRKAQKEKQVEKLEAKRKPAWKPAVAAKNSTTSKPSTNTCVPSCAPKSDKYQPPAAIKEVSANPTKTKRPSLYIAVATPEKKTSAPVSIARKVLQQAHIMKNAGLVTIRKCANTQKSELKNQNINIKPMATSTVHTNAFSSTKAAANPDFKKCLNTNPTTALTSGNTKPKINLKPTSNKGTLMKEKQLRLLSEKPKTTVTTSINAKTVAAVKPISTNPTKPTSMETKSAITSMKAKQPNFLSEKPKTCINTAKTTRDKPKHTIVLNFKESAIIRRNQVTNKRVESTNMHKKPNLAVGMKATKKPFVGNQVKSATSYKRPPPNKTAGRILLALEADSLPVAETPKELNSVNPFEKFVTSTKLKEEKVQECGISPIDFNEAATTVVNCKLSAGSSAKRTLLNPSDEKPTEVKQRKFNFEYYSVLNITEVDSILSPMKGEMEETEITIVAQKEPKPIENDPDATTVNISAEQILTTPPPMSQDERPINYMSPFVTVSRGKVSAKAERERRNSMYMANNEETPKKIDASQLPGTPVEDRRTLEAVRYFRKQLHDETERLRGMCAQWEEYKSENLTKLLELNCDDKIDSTIGQTMLLTGNKFQQFNGLIDRCAAGVTGLGAVQDNGSEDTKPVSATDLEGFWAMLGLQIENVEKRFAEIERWRANDWIDPDALVSQKPKKSNLANKITNAKNKVPKSKAKASSGLVELMRKKHAELRKLKGAASEANTSAEGTASNTTPRRRSIIVPNRKQFSPAATILTFRDKSTSKRRSESLGKVSVVEKTSLRKTAILSLINQSPDPQFDSPNRIKSILKTPGTSKNIRKSVVFSAKKAVRRFRFTIDDPASSDEEGQQEKPVANNCNIKETVEDCIADLTPIDNSLKSNVSGDNGGTPRSYRLRNRKVKLRPSCEIVVPR